MNCKDIRENMFELMSAPSDLADPAAMAHVKECSGCAGELASMRATMNLLDEWEAPEPSVYFLSRFQANLREEREKQPRSWFAWLRRPVLALTMVTIVAAGGSSTAARYSILLLRPLRVRRWPICRLWKEITTFTPASIYWTRLSTSRSRTLQINLGGQPLCLGSELPGS